MEKINVLFLDVDGVVNSSKTAQMADSFFGIDPYLAFLIGNMVDDLDLKVVLSSSWRNSEEGVRIIKEKVCAIMDVTPNIRGASIRGDEIKLWLDKHPEVEKYAIIDDDTDFLKEQMPNFFKTSWDTGVTPDIIEKIKKHFE